MKETTENMELEQMKEQLSVLKNKLDHEKIVNDKLIRSAMRSKISTINRDAVIVCVVALLGIPYCFLVFRYMFGISWWLTGVTDIFLAVAIFYTYITRKNVKAKDLMEGNLLEVSAKIARMKRMGANWLKFSIPFFIVWLTWFLLEASHGVNGEAVVIGGAVGAVIGTILGTRNYRKTQRLVNEVIQQIEELNGDSRIEE